MRLLLTLVPLLAQAQDWTDRGEYDLALAVRAQSSAAAMASPAGGTAPAPCAGPTMPPPLGGTPADPEPGTAPPPGSMPPPATGVAVIPVAGVIDPEFTAAGGDVDAPGCAGKLSMEPVQPLHATPATIPMANRVTR